MLHLSKVLLTCPKYTEDDKNQRAGVMSTWKRCPISSVEMLCAGKFRLMKRLMLDDNWVIIRGLSSRQKSAGEKQNL